MPRPFQVISGPTLSLVQQKPLHSLLLYPFLSDSCTFNLHNLSIPRPFSYTAQPILSLGSSPCPIISIIVQPRAASHNIHPVVPQFHGFLPNESTTALTSPRFLWSTFSDAFGSLGKYFSKITMKINRFLNVFSFSQSRCGSLVIILVGLCIKLSPGLYIKLSLGSYIKLSVGSFTNNLTPQRQELLTIFILSPRVSKFSILSTHWPREHTE